MNQVMWAVAFKATFSLAFLSGMSYTILAALITLIAGAVEFSMAWSSTDIALIDLWCPDFFGGFPEWEFIVYVAVLINMVVHNWIFFHSWRVFSKRRLGDVGMSKGC